MTSNAITEPREQPPGRASGRQELAPSVLRQDEPTAARAIGMLGAALLIFGGSILLLQFFGLRSVLSMGWVVLALAIGMAGLLFHAAYDFDLQFRRMYMGFGLLLLISGLSLVLGQWLQQYLLEAESKRDLFTPGVGCLALAVLFLLATLRHETQFDTFQLVTLLMLGAGSLLTLVGLGLGMAKTELLAPYGIVLPLVGLLYLVAFVGVRGTSDDLAYYTGWGIGVLGLGIISVAVVRSLISAIGNARLGEGLSSPEYFIPHGVLLILFGTVFLVASVLLCSESLLVVLIRRELGSYFFSPIFYIVLLAFTVAHWIAFDRTLIGIARRDQLIMEPVVARFILDWPAVFCNVFIVPALTMRLLSEEQRSGTLEVLLTAPISETAVVISKFFTGLLLYILMWLPFGLLLLSLRIMNGTDFDYRPLLSFAVVILATGSGFVAMGLLFSSLTRDQVASGVLTFAGMLTLTLVFLLQGFVTPAWGLVLKHMSYLDLWIDSLQGKLVPRQLMFPLSLAVFCLFLTNKVLESRKWK